MDFLDPLFGFNAMEKVFSDASSLQCMLDFEAALAKAEAKCGIVPIAAADAISSKCRAEFIDLPALASATAQALNPAIPLVKQLTALVKQVDPDAARFVHWGATSQDVNDTGLMLQMRQAFDILEKDLDSLRESFATLAQKYRTTPIAGRTLMQQAMPTTLGFKIAGWLDALNRHRERLAQVRQRVLALQFGGAVGTLAALRGKGLSVGEVLAQELSLPLPDVPWHTQRDRVAEVATSLGLLTGSLGKVARDIALHMQTEISEISEPAAEGRGGSSTMPHKRNPVSAGVILAAATRVPGLVSTMLNAMPQEDERGLGSWHAEWETLPEIFRLTASALHQLATIAPDLHIHEASMRRNLDLTHGLIFAEAITMALAAQIGKSAAHSILEEASQQALKSGQHLRDVLATNATVKAQLTTVQLDELFDPKNYLGSAEELIDRVIATTRNSRQ